MPETTTDPGREVQVKAGEETYTLYGGNRALRLIERETGMPFGDVVERAQKLDVTATTLVCWAFLQRHHPDLALDDLDDIIDAAGFMAVFEAVFKALELAFPDAVGRTNDVGKAAMNGASPGPGTRRSPAPSPRA